MGEGYNFKQLKERILSKSKAKDWEVARKEWGVVSIYESDEPEECLCGHFPIIEICQIRNRVTGESTEVGNRCVRRFLGFRADLIFKAIKRIEKDETKSLNSDAIAFFHKKSLFNDWEYEFLQDTMRKRNLTAKQMDMRRSLNKKVVEAIKKKGFQGPD